MKRFLIIGAIAALIILAGTWIYVSVSVPNLKTLQERKVVESTKIYDNTGKVLLYDIHSDIKRTLIPFDKIPQNLKNATVAIEDAEFYKHSGISFTSIIRSFIIDIISGQFRQGGSTITQQLVKKAFLTDDRTLSRKIKEVVLALKVESKYSKDEILNLYLNEIPYGASSFGVEAASETYFGKPAENLDLAESAYLAALPNAPTRYSPYGNHINELEARKNLILERMKNLKLIDDAEFNSAKKEKVIFTNRALEGIRAPHFVMYVKEYLVDKYGEDKIGRAHV